MNLKELKKIVDFAISGLSDEKTEVTIVDVEGKTKYLIDGIVFEIDNITGATEIAFKLGEET